VRKRNKLDCLIIFSTLFVVYFMRALLLWLGLGVTLTGLSRSEPLGLMRTCAVPTSSCSWQSIKKVLSPLASC
jgi:hypothetical protein